MKTLSKADEYVYRVFFSEEDDEFVATTVEFGPGLSWLASSPEDAVAGLRRVVLQALEDMAESGEVIPEPMGSKTYSGKLLVRLPPELHRRLSIEAAESGVSLNRLIAYRLSA